MNERTDFLTLMTGLRAGEACAVVEACRRYEDGVLVTIRRHLTRRLRSRFDSRDFLQEVWTTFLTAPAGRYVFTTPAELRAFLARLAHDKVIDAARHQAAVRFGGTRETAGGDAIDGLTSSAPRADELAMAGEEWERWLGRISPAHRGVAARVRDGYTHEEIAAMTGFSPRSIKRIVDRLEEVAAHDLSEPDD